MPHSVIIILWDLGKIRQLFLKHQTLLIKMASSSTDNIEDKYTHAEIEMWSVENLKEYCRRRGHKPSGSKKELVSRTYVLANSNVPVIEGERQKEVSRKKDYKSLYTKGQASPDPIKLKNWIDEKNGLKLWPPVTYLDIHWFMKECGSVGLNREAMTAYKTGKAYSYFQCDWLKEVFYCPISKQHECCYLKAKCTPGNRVNYPPHNLWVKIKKKSGDIVSAYCSCVAG